ncbi:MAG TPA: hypothetical protein VLS25_05800 [Dehalococcoidia bacterium]|nr:hypothetical protein [Dehalococcoidia bacterium]
MSSLKTQHGPFIDGAYTDASPGADSIIRDPATRRLEVRPGGVIHLH